MRYITKRAAIGGILALALLATTACDRLGIGGKGNDAIVSGSEYGFTIDTAMKPGLNTITLKNTGREEPTST